MGKIRTVDDDQRIRLFRDHRIGGFANAAQDAAQLFGDRGETDDRQVLNRKAGGEPRLRHRAAANALEAHAVSQTRAQFAHQAGAEPVAGFLRRDQE